MRSVKTVPCCTQEWDFCYHPYSVIQVRKYANQNAKPDGSVTATVILCRILMHVLSILL